MPNKRIPVRVLCPPIEHAILIVVSYHGSCMKAECKLPEGKKITCRWKMNFNYSAHHNAENCAKLLLRRHHLAYGINKYVKLPYVVWELKQGTTFAFTYDPDVEPEFYTNGELYDKRRIHRAKAQGAK